jgi:hypothetical protein
VEAPTCRDPGAPDGEAAALGGAGLLRDAERHQRLSPALAAVFSYELGQRSGDARRTMRSQFEGCRLRVTQNKTGKELLLPVSDALADRVAKAPRGEAQLVLNERTGQPYEDYVRSKAAAGIREAADLPLPQGPAANLHLGPG